MLGTCCRTWAPSAPSTVPPPSAATFQLSPPAADLTCMPGIGGTDLPADVLVLPASRRLHKPAGSNVPLVDHQPMHVQAPITGARALEGPTQARSPPDSNPFSGHHGPWVPDEFPRAHRNG
jgi:hypothetical protein